MSTGESERTAMEPKVVLLVRLLSAIDEGRFTFEELKDRIADERPPSTRSLRRYLAVLGEAGFPWFFDRATGTYRFVEGYSLRRLNLNPRELFGLVTLKRLGASLGGTLGSYIDDATGRLLASSDPKSEAQAASPSLSIRLDTVALEPHVERVFERLQTAERDRRRLAFTYVDKNGTRSERRADPYGFIVSGGRIYMVAYDHARSDMRVFAIDNISEVQTLPDTFVRPADFNLEAFGAHSVSGVMHAATRSEVTVRFSPVVAKAAIAAPVSRERRVERSDDGAVEITYAVVDPVEVVRWSFGWGAEAEVIAPEAARGIARDLARTIADRYRD